MYFARLVSDVVRTSHASLCMALKKSNYRWVFKPTKTSLRDGGKVMIWKIEPGG